MPVSRRAALKGLVAAGVGTVAGTGAYGYLGRHGLVVVRETLRVLGLPLALAGLRIGLLTDLHRSAFVSHEDIAHAVALLMADHPDLIVLGGDYVTFSDRRYVGPSAEALAPLRAPHGVFGILGNHDDGHDMPAALERNGVDVLRDARTRVLVGGEPIDLVGIRFWTKRFADIEALTREVHVNICATQAG